MSCRFDCRVVRAVDLVGRGARMMMCGVTDSQLCGACCDGVSDGCVWLGCIWLCAAVGEFRALEIGSRGFALTDVFSLSVETGAIIGTTSCAALESFWRWT